MQEESDEIMEIKIYLQSLELVDFFVMTHLIQSILVIQIAFQLVI